MDENGTYGWPGGQPQKPKKKADFKRVGRTALVVVLALLLLTMALTCFYTVDDKQQAVVTTFGKATDVTEAGVHFKLPFGIQRVDKVDVNVYQKIELGYTSSGSSYQVDDSESTMITGDYNIVNVDFFVDKVIESAVVYSTKDSEKIAKINQWITDSNRDKSVVTHGIGLSFFDLISFLQFDKEQVYLVVSSDKNKRAAGIVFLGEGGTPLFFGSLGGVMAKSVHNFEDVAFSVGEKQTWCVGEICENSKLGGSAEDIEIESFLRAFLLFFHI